MKYGLILTLLLVTACRGQTTATGQAETSGPCSPGVTGSNNIFTINCGIGKEQGQKMLNILNKILANQLDPTAVMVKLDEILNSINPNRPPKTYLCNGMWRIAGPGPNTALQIALGGDDSAFQDLVRLNNTRQYAELLKLCLSQIQSAPDWLTPRLFCGLAYLGIGDGVKAKSMLAEFDSRTGPAYQDDGCKEVSDYLHEHLR
jgi:hypothetical protein